MVLMLRFAISLEEPKPGKVVERGVTQVLTPGTLTDPNSLTKNLHHIYFHFFPQQINGDCYLASLLTAQIFVTIVPAMLEKAVRIRIDTIFSR